MIFAVSRIGTVRGTARYVNLYALMSLDPAVRKEALFKLIAASVHGHGVVVSEEDQLLLMVTCIDEKEDRLVVAARRLRPEETETRITMRQ